MRGGGGVSGVFVLTFAVVAHPPEAVPAFALVGARRVVAGGVAGAVAATQGALVHICNTKRTQTEEHQKR